MGMENSGGLSIADTLALQDRNDGMFGGNGGMWVFFLFFLLAWGGNGGLFGNASGIAQDYVLNSDFATLQRQIDSGISSLERKGDTINAGLCDGFYAMNTGMLNGFASAQNTMAQGFAGINTAIITNGYQTQGQIAQLSSDMQSCCCTTQRNIDAIRYENSQNTMAITNAIHAEGEQTRALLQSQETQRLRDELSQARDALSNNAQSQYILGQIGQYYTNPPCYGNTCCNA